MLENQQVHIHIKHIMVKMKWEQAPKMKIEITKLLNAFK